jgi:undecaprenyl-phosphate 4-deoxy-4-formamido-L-arabinose transferase
MNPFLSVVIPVYNEAANLEKLYGRLIPVLNSINQAYEIIFINDGSRDDSAKILENFYNRDSEVIKVIDFKANFGQHAAVIAGFELAKGQVIVTLDADLQNPPEEIPKLLEYIARGYDLVSGVRQERKDNFFRRNASRLINKIRAKITKINMTDHGSMLRAYGRNVIDLMIANSEATLFIPALAYSYALNPIEIPVSHEARFAGKSQYRFYDLVRLNFDLMTGYSIIPLQFFTLLGIFTSLGSILFFFYLLIRRFLVGPEVEGVFTLFAIMFFLIGIVLMGLGISGEYVGRIYKEVRRRPRFVVKRTLGVANEKENFSIWH